MTTSWSLLVYTVPTEPSRKRATIWRALKRLGAIYLRDGVAVLPQRPAPLDHLRAVAAQVEEFGGQATLIENAQLPDPRAAAVIAESQAARTAEYDAIATEAERFLRHLQREAEHRCLRPGELNELAADLRKVQTWFTRVRGRDYFGSPAVSRAQAQLTRCAEALAGYLGRPDEPAAVDQ